VPSCSTVGCTSEMESPFFLFVLFFFGGGAVDRAVNFFSALLFQAQANNGRA